MSAASVTVVRERAWNVNLACIQRAFLACIQRASDVHLPSPDGLRGARPPVPRGPREPRGVAVSLPSSLCAPPRGCCDGCHCACTTARLLRQRECTVEREGGGSLSLRSPLGGGARGAAAAPRGEAHRRAGAVQARTPPPLRTKWTRRVPHPVLIGHAASLSQVLQRDPVHFECLANLGKILFASGDFVQAPRPPLSSS